MYLTLRGHPAYNAIKKTVEKGQIGDVVSMYIKRGHALRIGNRAEWLFDEKKSGGIIVELAIHAVDYAMWLANSPVKEIMAYHGKAHKNVSGNFQDFSEIMLRHRVLSSFIAEKRSVENEDLSP